MRDEEAKQEMKVPSPAWHGSWVPFDSIRPIRSCSYCALDVQIMMGSTTGAVGGMPIGAWGMGRKAAPTELVRTFTHAISMRY